MNSLLRRLRPLTYFFALVQLALPGALGVAHAMTARDQQGTPAHVEQSGGLHCAVLHSDECAVCRHLTTGAMKVDLAPSLLPAVAGDAPIASIAPEPQSRWHRGFNSRAPPVVLI